MALQYNTPRNRKLPIHEPLQNENQKVPIYINKTLLLEDDNKSSCSESPTLNDVAVTLLEEGPFSSEASKILFDGIDELRRCSAAVDLDLPQLVIVGQQSAGKSSLLKSLTDIPFPVSEGLCTRFATYIISRRSTPDTSDIIKVSIEKGDSDLSRGKRNNKKEPFNPHVPSMTATVFADIFKWASEYIEITGQSGSKKNNFSSDILRIELHRPTCAYFGILDIPGVFHTLTDKVTDEGIAQVTAIHSPVRYKYPAISFFFDDTLYLLTMPSDYATKIKQRLLIARDIEDTRVVMLPYTRYVKENRRYIIKKERSARYRFRGPLNSGLRGDYETVVAP
ncbi:hypothetical protein G7Y89_g13407 [Cudoniella acicularis]|uniref:Dynamin N-terminal domain-containing protein n=1 Tax=Cudoniella acicularis TaxID=354080 RepID=A0A8H4VWG7_9HELO|nr:hypothetical protein G7Y89_g13407 [Cudoniella acicularis]